MQFSKINSLKLTIHTFLDLVENSCMVSPIHTRKVGGGTFPAVRLTVENSLLSEYTPQRCSTDWTKIFQQASS